MKLFNRFTGRPQYHTKVVTPEENKVANPETPIPEPVTVLVNLCAHCGAEGATHQYTSGDMYLKTLPYTFFCDTCWEQRQWLVQHPIARQHTRQEHTAVKPRGTRLQRIEQVERTPSRPLEDRVHNLATGA